MSEKSDCIEESDCDKCRKGYDERIKHLEDRMGILDNASDGAVTKLSQGKVSMRLFLFFIGFWVASFLFIMDTTADNKKLALENKAIIASMPCKDDFEKLKDKMEKLTIELNKFSK